MLSHLEDVSTEGQYPTAEAAACAHPEPDPAESGGRGGHSGPNIGVTPRTGQDCWARHLATLRQKYLHFSDGRKTDLSIPQSQE